VESQLLTTATVVALCAAAGVRAYLPLLAMGVAARLGVIPLQPGYEWLTSTPLLVGLGVLAVIEILADKVPGVDHVNDAVHTVVRPVSGALIFALSNNVISAHSLPAAVLAGLALAGGVHATKASVRPFVTASTIGVGNPFVSLAEDLGVTGLIVLAFVLPLLALLITAGVIVFVLWAGSRLLRRRPAPGSA
jgi:hypothetical protein